MIAAQSLGIQFGGDFLFRDVGFMISPGERIGLVGSNGAGKTTLMRTLIGAVVPDEGSINTGRHTVIGYLPQEGVVLSEATVRDEAMSAFGEVVAMERAIVEMSEEVGRRTDHESPAFGALLEDLGELQHRFEAMNGFAAVGSVDKILMGLGFRPSDLERPCREFSGGWQMRIELAKLLLQQPDLLMLDEPTNHLDIESLTWLETFLQRYVGSILLISHDRAFLDAITNRTFELSMGRLTVYTGNYGSYLKQRTERRELQQSAYENQQKAIADTERFIERFRYKATKATQVQSRVKALDRLDRVAAVESDEAAVHFSFPKAPRSGRVVIEMKAVEKSYGDNHVLRAVDFAVERGEKVAFLGRNGEGKSTFSRIIAGIESFQHGERIMGHNASIGYFAQHQAEDLDQRRTVLETLDAVATGDIRLRLRTLLGAFLFQGDDVFKRVGVLSGGEKSRLALAKLLLEPVSLLILDEPTNHLDMKSKEVLKDALIKFDGALIVVSHDRDFLSGIVGKCIEFKDEKIREYIGGIEDYLIRHQTASIDDVFGAKRTAATESRAATGGADDGISAKERKRIEAEQRNRRYAATKDLKKRRERIEGAIAKLEAEKAEAAAQLAQPEMYGDFEKSRLLNERLADLEKRLADNYESWAKIAAEIEKVEEGL